MATLTAIDLQNVGFYSMHLHRLRFIPKWRTKLPHILIDYEIRLANNDDFYIPKKLANKAIYVKLTFSKKGCDSMSCYPYNETGPIKPNTRMGYTQLSDVSVRYGQPACFNLDRVAATREGSENRVQAPELRYTDAGQCLLIDTLSKLYLNTPYIRSDEHIIKGVDDVPGFNVYLTDDPLFPERVEGTFNNAYCQRFGRSLNPSGGCNLQWWESLIGFVLGDTIYITLKLLTNNIFSDIRNFDFTRPSVYLPRPPTVNTINELQRWRDVRDSTADVDFELSFNEYKSITDLGLSEDITKLIYRADQGFVRERAKTPRNLQFRQATKLGPTTFDSDQDLEQIITQFLEDNALIIGIATSIGFDVLMDGIKALLKKINTTLIPLLKQTLLNTSARVTVRILGETYKAVMVQSLNRIAVKTVTAVAKALTRIAIKAASVVGIILTIIGIGDLILGLWDPFGYNNMFPARYPRDLSNAFLTAYFQSINDGTTDLIEFIPEYFSELVDAEEDNVITIDSISDSLDYVSSLTVNSNGQMLELDDGEQITDFDEVSLVGSALASSALYTHLEFLQYTQRHNDILYENRPTSVLVPALFVTGALILMTLPRDTNVIALFVVFILLALYTLILDSLSYYLQIRRQTSRLKNKWYNNLYDFE
ncbi:p74 [Alphabaculovirus alterspexiguae]|uniref:p74 n=1 Tax=Spodoptera exigua multiple nucleopolyhedrovirus TaxID=10454 RepID=A0A3G2JU55_9ABAC|nr:p74 [Spodoptera exigua multiple nucleopolyhedrovirus]AYN45079.1 p74 [Spodoptera exigua multiple nucleopolyhedrovirus]